jgi:hypothetical protein
LIYSSARTLLHNLTSTYLKSSNSGLTVMIRSSHGRERGSTPLCCIGPNQGKTSMLYFSLGKDTKSIAIVVSVVQTRSSKRTNYFILHFHLCISYIATLAAFLVVMPYLYPVKNLYIVLLAFDKLPCTITLYTCSLPSRKQHLISKRNNRRGQDACTYSSVVGTSPSKMMWPSS